MDYLTDSSVGWNKMPDEFEHYRVGDTRISQPSDFTAWRKRLERTFPVDARGIRRWFRTINSATRWATHQFMWQFMPPPIGLVLRLWSAIRRRRNLRTTGSVLRRFIRTPTLRAILTATWGDYGLPPDESTLAIHALIATHYRDGAWFPEGGSGVISRAIEATIERAGGACLVGREATRLLQDDAGRVVGVQVRERADGGRLVDYFADTVVSSIGVPATLGLLDRDRRFDTRDLDTLRRDVAAIRPGYSAVTLYVRLKESASVLGVQGENYWIDQSATNPTVDKLTAGLVSGRPRHAYLSFPSLKSGDTRFHTAEIVAPVDPAAFSEWAAETHGRHGSSYVDLKNRMTRGLVELADAELPGFAGLVSYAELSTPLSIEHFTARRGGAFYGIPARPERYRVQGLHARSPVAGLFFSGSDVGSLGIVGAMMAGVTAAVAILGGRSFPGIMAGAYRHAAGGPSASAPDRDVPSEPVRNPDRYHATLVRKTAVTPSIVQVELDLDRPMAYRSGQFVKLEVGPREWRDYSIANLDGKCISFLVSVATGGDGSAWFTSAEPGDQVRLDGPYGTFTLSPHDHSRVFVATGTGLAPLLPMMATTPAGTSRRLLVGSTTYSNSPLSDAWRAQLNAAGVTIVDCTSRESINGAFHGRVTAALEQFEFDPAGTEFYVCGKPEMIQDVLDILQRRGAHYLFTEPF
jgi:NAD(P)H-flavin reductase/phytoene dehydrogenase-like protein